MHVLHVADQFQVEVCNVMCDRLKLSIWRVQLGVLRAMKVFYQGYAYTIHNYLKKMKIQMHKTMHVHCLILHCINLTASV